MSPPSSIAFVVVLVRVDTISCHSIETARGVSRIGAFDAGSGEVCLIRRIPTNTPLQALVTMNDPVFIEAAGALAQLCSSETAIEADAALMQAMFRRVLLRPAAEDEQDRLLKLLKAATQEFRSAPAEATDLITSANLQSLVDPVDHSQMAARTVVASVLLNLDETITRP